MMAPAVAAITLGLVKQQGYAHQLGRNEAFNHAGNVTAALLAGFFGYLFGLGAVFAVMAAMAVGAMVAVATIDPDRIDHKAARGLGTAPGDQGTGFSVLVTSGPLLVLGLTLLLFHLGNAAMLPLLGQALVGLAAEHLGYAAAFLMLAGIAVLALMLWVVARPITAGACGDAPATAQPSQLRL